MSAATISQLRASVAAIINAGGFGVTASEAYLGARDLAEISSLTVEVVADGGDAEQEASDTAELRRRVIVVVRQRAGDGASVSEIDAVAELAESIGVHLLNTIPSDVAATPITLGYDGIDPDALAEGVAISSATVTYLVQGA
jgi:hypothetical protein